MRRVRSALRCYREFGIRAHRHGHRGHGHVRVVAYTFDLLMCRLEPALVGLPPKSGLYLVIVPCVIAAPFGSSWHAVSGPGNSLAMVFSTATLRQGPVEHRRRLLLVVPSLRPTRSVRFVTPDTPEHRLVTAESTNFIDLPATELSRNELRVRRPKGGDLYFHRPRLRRVQEIAAPRSVSLCERPNALSPTTDFLISPQAQPLD